MAGSSKTGHLGDILGAKVADQNKTGGLCAPAAASTDPKEALIFRYGQIPRPCPDEEARISQRSLDLISGDESRSMRSRSSLVIRQFMVRFWKSLEVSAGQITACASLFITHHITWRLRIAPGAYAFKRIGVDSFGPCDRINRSAWQKDDFRVCSRVHHDGKLYMAYADYKDLIELTSCSHPSGTGFSVKTRCLRRRNAGLLTKTVQQN